MPPMGKPFQKGQSGNPSGRPKKDRSLEAWRTANAAVLQDIVAPDEVKDIWNRWIARFKVGDPKALWLVPYLFGQPPKAAEPEQPSDSRVDAIEIRRREKRDAGGDAGGAAAPV